MVILAFILECAAIATFMGSATSIVAALSWIGSHRILARLSPNFRADVAFVLGIVPGILAVVGTGAAALPPILSAAGLSEDHCLSHSHHLHLCLVHSTELRATLAAVGALGLAVFSLRASSLLKNVLDKARDLRELERLGVRSSLRSSVIEVPGGPRFCHALGYLEGRILLSSSLAALLHRDHLDCALAHESAHLRRRDPLLNLLLSFASLFQLPVSFNVLRRAYGAAAEEACDDDAARSIGDASQVAEALVAVAAIQRRPSGLVGIAPAFGEHALERRVRRLLSGARVRGGQPRALLLGAVLGSGVTSLAIGYAPAVHHAVETVLHRLL